jgi:hypothetical protein
VSDRSVVMPRGQDMEALCFEPPRHGLQQPRIVFHDNCRPFCANGPWHRDTRPLDQHVRQWCNSHATATGNPLLESDEEVFEALLGHLPEVEVLPPSGARLVGDADVYVLKNVVIDAVPLAAGDAEAWIDGAPELYPMMLLELLPFKIRVRGRMHPGRTPRATASRHVEFGGVAHVVESLGIQKIWVALDRPANEQRSAVGLVLVRRR